MSSGLALAVALLSAACSSDGTEASAVDEPSADVAIDVSDIGSDPSGDVPRDHSPSDPDLDPPATDSDPDLPDLNDNDDNDDASAGDTLDGVGADIADASNDDLAPDLTRDAGPDPCGPRAPPDTSGPWIEVGTGYLEYEALEPCQGVTIVRGIQDGFHIWGGFLAGGFDAGEALFVIEFRLLQEGEVIGGMTLNDYLNLYGSAEEGYTYHTFPVTLPLGFDAETLLGEQVTLAVHVAADGIVDLADSVVIVPIEIGE